MWGHGGGASPGGTVHLLEGESVTRYFGGLAAVSGVDFYVDEGEVLGLIGPNGAGKTTLFNLISAALTPKPGVIRFEGREITHLKPYRICRLGIARTFQTVKIFGGLPVMQNVLAAAYFGGDGYVSHAEATARAGEALEFVGMAPVAGTMAQDLTLANQKKLEVARALATRPKLLLLDEIMAGLTQTEVVEAMALIRRIKERGITIVMIEHVMHAIMNICDRIIVLDHGKKLADGTPQQVAADPKVVEVYLGEETDAGSQQR
jgi:branched-chain amino acid transport system ATP-binding protein